MYLSSTHFYLFMTISCLILISIISSCNGNNNNNIQQQHTIDDTSIEKLPLKYNESRQSICTTSSSLTDNTNETESK